MSLLFSQEANNDVVEISAWYEQQREGLGLDFMQSLEKSLAFIEKNPLAVPIRISKSRAALMKKFPFQIVFMDKGDSIYIVGVIHTSRSPSVIRKRLKK